MFAKYEPSPSPPHDHTSTHAPVPTSGYVSEPMSGICASSIHAFLTYRHFPSNTIGS
ncbi:hypothetical protein PILCRDRAFT_819546 [Piloderma croceum F 1598]|uniref:Uncharacterized protein n=1 Tax=Piloderma croceum (strain F 1598) TaxID=765440 RepID=A0A0C3C137_PILCF|nr:hypothetical protein PILCRDRAFT_819546 [Piloderma croceum F 1598]